MVFSCTPLSRRAIQLSVDLPLGCVLNLVPTLEEIRIQEGSLTASSFALGTSSWGFWVWSLLYEGAQAPFFSTIPSLQFNAYSLVMLFLMGSCRWSAPNCYKDNSTSLPLGHPSRSHKVPHGLLPNPVGVFTFHLCLSWHSPLPGVPSAWWVF